jgi:hypothetical protein
VPCSYGNDTVIIDDDDTVVDDAPLRVHADERAAFNA